MNASSSHENAASDASSIVIEGFLVVTNDNSRKRTREGAVARVDLADEEEGVEDDVTAPEGGDNFEEEEEEGAGRAAAPCRADRPPSLPLLLKKSKVLSAMRMLRVNGLLRTVRTPKLLYTSVKGKPVYKVSLRLDRRLVFTFANSVPLSIALCTLAIFCPSQPLLCWLDMAVNYTAACNPAFLDGSAAAGRGHTAAYRALPAPARAAIALVSLRHFLTDPMLRGCTSLRRIPLLLSTEVDEEAAVVAALDGWLTRQEGKCSTCVEHARDDEGRHRAFIVMGESEKLRPERVGFVHDATRIFLGTTLDYGLSQNSFLRMVLGLSSLARFLVPPAAVETPSSPFTLHTWDSYKTAHAWGMTLSDAIEEFRRTTLHSQTAGGPSSLALIKSVLAHVVQEDASEWQYRTADMSDPSCAAIAAACTRAGGPPPLTLVAMRACAAGEGEGGAGDAFYYAMPSGGAGTTAVGSTNPVSVYCLALYWAAYQLSELAMKLRPKGSAAWEAVEPKDLQSDDGSTSDSPHAMMRLCMRLSWFVLTRKVANRDGPGLVELQRSCLKHLAKSLGKIGSSGAAAREWLLSQARGWPHFEGLEDVRRLLAMSSAELKTSTPVQHRAEPVSIVRVVMARVQEHFDYISPFQLSGWPDEEEDTGGGEGGGFARTLQGAARAGPAPKKGRQRVLYTASNGLPVNVERWVMQELLEKPAFLEFVLEALRLTGVASWTPERRIVVDVAGGLVVPLGLCPRFQMSAGMSWPQASVCDSGLGTRVDSRGPGPRYIAIHSENLLLPTLLACLTADCLPMKGTRWPSPWAETPDEEAPGAFRLGMQEHLKQHWELNACEFAAAMGRAYDTAFGCKTARARWDMFDRPTIVAIAHAMGATRLTSMLLKYLEDPCGNSVGLPDIVVVRVRECGGACKFGRAAVSDLLLLEAKSSTDSVRPEQEAWMGYLRQDMGMRAGYVQMVEGGR